MEELNIGQVIISKQKEDSENYQKFLKIVKDKDINVKQVKIGDKVKINKDIYFDILWPEEEQITDNILNNNAIVMKLNYFDFSMLFTGDIEKKAEEKILEKYKGKEKMFKADIIKVAHHGSKTSSMESFLELVKPEIALIGVGKNNLFNHPSQEVIERLNKRNIKIYRTDENGEITIIVDRKQLKIVAKERKRMYNNE